MLKKILWTALTLCCGVAAAEPVTLALNWKPEP